jgi:hypothetical protein
MNFEIVEIRHARFQQRQVKEGSKFWQEIEKLFLNSPSRIDDCFTCGFCLEDSMADDRAPYLVQDAIDLSVPLENLVGDEPEDE